MRGGRSVLICSYQLQLQTANANANLQLQGVHVTMASKSGDMNETEGQYLP